MVLSVRPRILRSESAQRRRQTGRGNEFKLHGGANKSPGHGGGHPNARRYRSGEIVRQSGIYEVLHDRDHREVHEAVMISGEHFPECETCRAKVRFRLIRTAPYIFQDEDFEENV